MRSSPAVPCHEAFLRERHPPREIADVAKRSVRLALGDESVGIVLSYRLDVGEPDSDCLRPMM